MTRNGVNVCPQAWYLQRGGGQRSPTGAKQLEDGRRAHQRLGANTDRLRRLLALRKLLLACIAVLAVAIAIQLTDAADLVRP